MFGKHLNEHLLELIKTFFVGNKMFKRPDSLLFVPKVIDIGLFVLKYFQFLYIIYFITV